MYAAAQDWCSASRDDLNRNMDLSNQLSIIAGGVSGIGDLRVALRVAGQSIHIDGGITVSV